MLQKILQVIALLVLNVLICNAYSQTLDYNKKQIQVLESEAQANNINALHKLTNFYFSRGEYKKAYKFILQGVKLHDLGSIGNQGIYYIEGLAGLKENYTKGRKELLIAAKDGNPGTFNELGLIYANGYGVAKDPNRAREYYEKAIHLGSEQAEFNLAMLMMSYHPKLAFEMFHALAKYKSNHKAMLNLGWLYQNGYAVSRSYQKAYMWYTVAATDNYHSKEILNIRFLLTKKMTPAQIAEGKQLVKEYYAVQSNSE